MKRIFVVLINFIIFLCNKILPWGEQIQKIPLARFRTDGALEITVWRYALSKQKIITEEMGSDGYKEAVKECSRIREHSGLVLAKYLAPYFSKEMEDINRLEEWHRWFSSYDFKDL